MRRPLSFEDAYGSVAEVENWLSSVGKLAFAQSSEEAQRRYMQTHQSDPFPDVLPALLNTADVCKYVARTGMIFPFNFSAGDLKLATYNFRAGGQIVWWDSSGDKQKFELKEDSGEFVLKGNSIAFMTLEPELRIPDYLALRFNLRVDNVYRGLLLGTGPIIDPGYVGRLSIPLHNLTTNDYSIKYGDKIISVEFTKLSIHSKWNVNAVDASPYLSARINELSAIYFPYKPTSKVRNPNERDVEYHIDQASPNKAVKSSIPEITAKAELSASEARDELSRARRQSNVLGIALVVAIVSIFVSLVIGGIAVGSFYFDFRSDRQAYLQSSIVPENIDAIEQEIRALRGILESMCEALPEEPGSGGRNTASLVEICASYPAP